MMTDAAPSVYHRLRSTPMRDLICGRVTGRLDVKRIITAADLPEPAAALVLDVVKRTRLWRLEKISVATELIAHCKDGLDAGRDVDDLIATFGEPRQTARLIRRAKKRNRPLIWHGCKWCIRAMLVMFAVYALAWMWLITGEPNPSVDYVAKMNAPAQAVPKDDRAWPIYREAFIRHGFTDLDNDALYVENESGGKRLARPNDAGWQDAVAYLEAHHDLLDAFRRGGAKPGLGLSIGFDWDFQGDDRLALYGPDHHKADAPGPREDRAKALADGSVIAILLPNLGHMRKMTRYLAIDLRYAAEQGDADRAMLDIQSMLGLSRQSRETPTLINDLVAHSILTMALKEIAHLLHDRPTLFSQAQWTDLAHTLTAFDDYAEPNFEGERMFMLDTFQRIYSDNGQITYDGLRFIQHLTGLLDDTGYAFQGPAEDAVLSVGLPLAAVLMADRDEMQSEYDRLWGILIEEARRPLWEQVHTPSRVDEQIGMWQLSWRDKIRYWPLVTLMPALDAAARTTRNTIALRDAVQVAIALELYRRQHGGYPDTLDALVPRYLPTLPVDDSTGKPMLYRLVDGKPMLYGRGIDGDDDSGVMSKDATDRWPRFYGSRMARDDDGDWVLHPPPRKGE